MGSAAQFRAYGVEAGLLGSPYLAFTITMYYFPPCWMLTYYGVVLLVPRRQRDTTGKTRHGRASSIAPTKDHLRLSLHPRPQNLLSHLTTHGLPQTY